MTLLSKSQTAEVIESTAERIASRLALTDGFQTSVTSAAAFILARRIEETAGDLASHIVLPMKTVEVMVALSAKQIPAYLPVVRTAEGKHGCKLSDVLTHISTRTESPKPTRKTRQ